MAKFTTYFSGLTQDTDPQGDSDFVMIYDTSTSGIKKVLITDFGFLTSGLSTDTKLDDLAAPDDNTDLNSDTDSHGLLMKLSGDSDTYLNGVGGWATVTGSGGFTTGDIHMVELHRSELTTDGNFDVSSISQDYDHLKIYILARSSVAATEDGTRIYFNNDTTDGSYSREYIGAVNNTAYYNRADNSEYGAVPGANSLADDYASAEITIINYAGDQKKVAICLAGWRKDATNQATFTTSINWESTSAINRITIQPDGYATQKFVAGSWLQIIGIKTEA